MSKAGTTYWGKTTRTTTYKKVATRKSKSKAGNTPPWFGFAVTFAVFAMICIVVNLRAFHEKNAEAVENQRLTTEFEKASSENLNLKEEIRNLKSDSGTIEREARKMGMSRPNEKVLVPTN